MWEIEKAANLLSIPCGKAVKFVHCNAVEPIVYSGHSDGSVRLYSINQGNAPITQIKGIIDYPINSISLLSSRHQLLVSSQEGNIIHLLDLKMNKSMAKYEHKDFFNTSVRADISPAENFVVAGNCDGSIYYWQKDKKQFERKVSGHDSPVTALKYHFISSILASCDKDGSVILWQ